MDAIEELESVVDVLDVSGDFGWDEVGGHGFGVLVWFSLDDSKDGSWLVVEMCYGGRVNWFLVLSVTWYRVGVGTSNSLCYSKDSIELVNRFCLLIFQSHKHQSLLLGSTHSNHLLDPCLLRIAYSKNLLVSVTTVLFHCVKSFKRFKAIFALMNFRIWTAYYEGKAIFD